MPARRLFRVVNGGTPTSEAEHWGGDVPWATPIDLGRANGAVLESTERMLTRRALLAGSSSVPAGALIVSSRAPIGYVVETVTEMAFNQGCKGLLPTAPLDLRFFRYQLSAMSARLQAAGQGSTFRELSGDMLASTPLVAPGLEDQRAIADFLDAETARIDALIAKKRSLATLLRERQISVTIDGVSGAICAALTMVESDLPWLSGQALESPTVQLGLVARLGSGHTPSREHPEWWIDCTIPWITTGEVAGLRSDRVEFITQTRECISHIGLANSAAELHPAGTVFLCRTASAGYSGIMGRDMATSQDFVTWTCSPLLEPRYLLLCLRAMRHDLLGRLAMGSTHQTIYMPDVQSLKIPLPPLDTQRAIVAATWRKLTPLHRAMDAIGDQVALLQERRQALITAAVTGQIDIPSAPP